MPENLTKDQDIAVLVPYRDTFEDFLGSSQEILRKAYEEKCSRNGKEKNHWDEEEEDLIYELRDFQTRRREEEGTAKDRPPSPPSRWRQVERLLGDEEFFPAEGRGKPPENKEKICSLINQASYMNKINEQSSTGKIVRLIQKVFGKQNNPMPSEDLMTRYVRLWKVHQKDPVKNYSKISMREWWLLVKFDKPSVKNALLIVLVPPVYEQWDAEVGVKLTLNKKPCYVVWESSEVPKLKKQVTSIVYSALHSEGEARKKFGKLMNNIFQEQNENEQILKLFRSLLRLSGQLAS